TAYAPESHNGPSSLRYSQQSTAPAPADHLACTRSPAISDHLTRPQTTPAQSCAPSSSSASHDNAGTNSPSGNFSARWPDAASKLKKPLKPAPPGRHLRCLGHASEYCPASFASDPQPTC